MNGCTRTLREEEGEEEEAYLVVGWWAGAGCEKEEANANGHVAKRKKIRSKSRVEHYCILR